MAHLPLDADRVEPALREVRAIGVAQVVERELRDPDRVETGGVGCLVEAARGDVAIVHRATSRRREDEVILTRQPIQALDHAEMRMEQIRGSRRAREDAAYRFPVKS